MRLSKMFKLLKEGNKMARPVFKKGEFIYLESKETEDFPYMRYHCNNGLELYYALSCEDLMAEDWYIFEYEG